MVRNSRNQPDDMDFFGHRDFLYFCHRRRPLDRLRAGSEQSRRSTQRSQRYSPRKGTEVFDTDLHRLTLFFICHRAARLLRRFILRSRSATENGPSFARRSGLREGGSGCEGWKRAQRCSQLRVLGEHSSQSELFQNATPSTTRAYRPSIKLTACSTPLR